MREIRNDHLYTGRELDVETGLQLNRNRYYHQQLGRWMTRDPIGYEGGTNLYGYVDSQPARFVDPSGYIRDERGASKRYCDAARENPKNKWLKCACRVSRMIDGAMAGFGATAWAIGRNDPEHRGVIARGKWFRCMRSCMVRKWQEGHEGWKSGNPSETTTDGWKDVCDECPGDEINSMECCKLQVKAEHQGFDECTKECGKWKWGNAFPVKIMPGWPKGGDFSDLQTRIDYGVAQCCEGNAFGPVKEK